MLLICGAKKYTITFLDMNIVTGRDIVIIYELDVETYVACKRDGKKIYMLAEE